MSEIIFSFGFVAILLWLSRYWLKILQICDKWLLAVTIDACDLDIKEVFKIFGSQKHIEKN